MSDYCGAATLEDWLAEEVFPEAVGEIPEEAVKLFEKWRSGIESDIESWMVSDADGEGNSYSWRGWGRGFNSVQEDEAEFDHAVHVAQHFIDISGS